MTDRSLTSKEQATKPPYDLALPTITVQMLGDYGQEGFFEKTDKPVNGVAGVNWSQASVDFACEIVRPAVWAEIERLRAALEHLSLYVAVNGDDWVQKTAREYLNGKPAPTLSSMRPPTDETSREPAAWLVVEPDDWRYLASTRAAAEHIVQLRGGKLVPLFEGSVVETTEQPAIGETCPKHDWYRLNAAGCPVCHREKQQAHSSGKASVLRKTRYCDYDLCPYTFDPAHSNNDH